MDSFQVTPVRLFSLEEEVHSQDDSGTKVCEIYFAVVSCGLLMMRML